MGEDLNESTLSSYTATDGDNIAVQDWPAPESIATRGMVLLVHGLGEHAGRYQRLAQRLNGWGFAVRGYDQYGHGESDGVRGALPREGRLVDDLTDLITSTRKRMAPGMPLILFGHSMGGLVAALQVALERVPIEGLVLSSPALALRLNPVRNLLLGTLPKFAPHFTTANGVDPNLLSRDYAVVAAYAADRLVHDRMSARLGAFIAQAGPQLIARAPQWKVPTLLLYAGDDKVVDPQGSRDFAAAAPKDVVSAQAFPRLYHEIFNELDNEPVYGALKQWLGERF
jgi:alpha-beta hydrolase superfamily lysophospholipase